MTTVPVSAINFDGGKECWTTDYCSLGDSYQPTCLVTIVILFERRGT